VTTVPMTKIPAQPKDDNEFFFGRIYTIPIRYEERHDGQAPRIISPRLNKPRKSKSHIRKTGIKPFLRMMGIIERGRGWIGCPCCHDENGKKLSQAREP